MSQEDEFAKRLRQCRRVLKVSAPANPFYLEKKKTKYKEFGWKCPDVPESYEELGCPVEGVPGTSYNISRPHFPLVRQEGYGSIVANYSSADKSRLLYLSLIHI